MTTENFIEKWLSTGYTYNETEKKRMRDDLDKVIEYAQQQVKNCNKADVSNTACECSLSDRYFDKIGSKCLKCGKIFD